MSVRLSLHDEGDITLPAAIANSSLTLAEIGAVVCFAALQQGEEFRPERFNDEMHKAVESLKAKGVFSMRTEGNTLKLDFDLASVMPEENEEESEG